VETGRDAGEAPGRPPSMERTRPRRSPARWLALAAVLAGVLLVPLALSRSGGDDAGSADFAVLLANRQSGLPTGWAERQRPWSETRGGGVALIEDALAARLGALNTDLALAIQARQADETELLAAQIVARLDNSGISAVGVAAGPYREIQSRPGEAPETLAPLLKEGRTNIADFVGSDAFALGAWAEAARIAAHQQDAAFFRTRESRRMLERAAKLETLDESTRGSVEALRAASRGDAAPDWAALRTHADKLLSHLAQ
jgi:hypothetical protein